MTQAAPAPAPQMASVFPVGFPPHADTIHLGNDDLPYVQAGDGIELQLLHVDLNAGLWINRTRLKPGTQVPTHFHAGMVLAVTLQGRWYYLESPEQVNSPGSYLFEPAGSVHTLQAEKDQTEDTVAWFAIWGPNINVDASQNVTAVLDAHTVLTLYRGFCQAQGLDCSKLVVIGE